MQLSGVPSPALSLKHLPAHTKLCLSDGLWSLKAFWHRCSHGEARHATCPHSGAARAQPQPNQTDPDAGGEGGARLRGLRRFTSPRPCPSTSRSGPAPPATSDARQPVQQGAGPAPRRLSALQPRPAPVPPVQAVLAAATLGPSAARWGRRPAPPRRRVPPVRCPSAGRAAAGCPTSAPVGWVQLGSAEPRRLLPPVAFLSFCRAGFAQHLNWVATSISHGASAGQAETCRENFGSAGLTENLHSPDKISSTLLHILNRFKLVPDRTFVN